MNENVALKKVNDVKHVLKGNVNSNNDIFYTAFFQKWSSTKGSLE